MKSLALHHIILYNRQNAAPIDEYKDKMMEQGNPRALVSYPTLAAA